MKSHVEGYGVVSEGEVYHPSAFFDPAEEFKFAGDPEKQAEHQETLKTQAPVVEITDEQSNADPATSTVKVDEPLSGDQEAKVISTKKPEVVVTETEEPNVVTEGPTGVVTDKDDVTEGGATFEEEEANSQPAPLAESTKTETKDEVKFS